MRVRVRKIMSALLAIFFLFTCMPPVFLEKAEAGTIYVTDTRTFTVTANDGSQIPQTVTYTKDGFTTTLNLKEIKGYTVTKTEQVPVYKTETKTFTKTTTKSGISKNDSNFASTYAINEDGYTGTIPRTKIDWLVNSYYPTTKTITETRTGAKNIINGTGGPPSSISVSYYDPNSGKTVTGNIPKSGSTTWGSKTYEYMGGPEAPCFGYFSDNSTYYCNDGTDWVKFYYYNKPRKPESVYKSNPFRQSLGRAATNPDNGWTVYQYDWWINKSEPGWESNNATHGRTNTYYTKYPWYQEGTRRKLVWVKYYRTKSQNWTQKYSGTLTLPKTPKDYKGTATYSGTLSKQVLDRYNTVPTEWQAEVVYEGYMENYTKSISVDPASVNIRKGDAKQLTVTALLSDGTSENVTSKATYSSSNTSVATVGTGGLVTGKAVGTAKVTVTYKGKSAYVDVNVFEPIVERIKVISEEGNILRRGGALQLKTTAVMSDGTIKNVTNEANYESSNPSIAKVSNTGVVTGLGEGSTLITAEYDNKTDTIKIEICPKLYIYIRRLL